MTREDFISSPVLGPVIITLLETDKTFKAELLTVAGSIAADIESASTNPTCSCRDRVVRYVTGNNEIIGGLLYDYAQSNNKLDSIIDIFNTAKIASAPSISGRVAKTTIAEWPNFAKSVANLNYRHVSTSIVGDDVFIFFL